EIHKDTLEYIKGDDDKFIGVGDLSSGVELINADSSIYITIPPLGIIDKVKFRELCIAWLALNYPDSLKFDEEILALDAQIVDLKNNVLDLKSIIASLRWD
ncbi:MAG: hypothetical protein O6499_00140, partial [Candidatus Dadabacteria bacterium]|nr:hypothetical protein [Candidatus Dadabacteria bacterium]